MFREIYTKNLVDRATAPEIPALLREYEALVAPDGHVWFEDFNLSTLDSYRDNLIALSPDGAGDYTYLHFGRNIVRDGGYDLTGRRLSDLGGEAAIFYAECYEQVLNGSGPLYTIHRSIDASRAMLWERLVLPVQARTGQPFVFVYSKALNFREDLLGAVLESSPNGIIALQAVRSTNGEICDAIVVTANPRACEILDRSAEDIAGTSAFATLPLLQTSGLWPRCLEVMQHGSRDHLDIDYQEGDNQQWFQVSLAPLRDGVALTFTDVTDLKRANLALQSRAASLAVEIGRERATTEALSSEITRQRKLETELRQMAETDPLTGLLNRRSFDAVIDQTYAKAVNTGAPLSLLMLDLDHFKAINDTHGHAAGDAALRETAHRLVQRLRRDSDSVARVGGEEFAILLPNTRIEGAVRVAEMLRNAIDSTSIALPKGAHAKLTTSIGVAELLANEALSALFARADEALYAAKGMGRNRVEIARRNSLPGRRDRVA